MTQDEYPYHVFIFQFVEACPRACRVGVLEHALPGITATNQTPFLASKIAGRIQLRFYLVHFGPNGALDSRNCQPTIDLGLLQNELELE